MHPSCESAKNKIGPLSVVRCQLPGSALQRTTDHGQRTFFMFDALKNLGNLGELMRKAGEMKARMAQMQEELAKKTVTADAGGGMVEATVNGRLELVRLKIDKARVDLSDTEMLEDLVVAAVHAAQTKA